MALPFLLLRVVLSAIYRRKFKPQIFTDITTPVKQIYSPNTGMKCHDVP